MLKPLKNKSLTGRENLDLHHLNSVFTMEPYYLSTNELSPGTLNNHNKFPSMGVDRPVLKTKFVAI